MKGLFLYRDGEKDRLNVRSVFILILIFLLALFLLFLSSPNKRRGLNRGNRNHLKYSAPLETNLGKSFPTIEDRELEIHFKKSSTLTTKSNSHLSDRQKRKEINQNLKIEYLADQIVGRDASVDSKDTLPFGIRGVGKLLDSIDTRQKEQVVRIALFNGLSQKGKRLIPKNTVVLAQVSYPEEGEKVFMKIFKAIFPDGREQSVVAQVLNPKDFSPGISGKYHGTLIHNALSSAGLSFISDATDVLQDKIAVGSAESTVIIPQSTMKNALLKGASAVTREGALDIKRHSNSKKPYVTLEAPIPVLISLTDTFRISP